MEKRKAEEHVLKRALNLFFIIFLTAGSLLAGGAASFYKSELEGYISGLKAEERHSVELQHAAVSREFTSIVGDLLFISRENELYKFLATGSGQVLKEIEAEYIHLAESKRMYDQIRLLNSQGMEEVRVDYNGLYAHSIPLEELQDKGQRYYFLDSYALQNGKIFVSPLDLNVEHGEIEKPYKPMIRFGTPIFDHLGRKRGIVLFNYLATHLIERMLDVGASSPGNKMLLNSEGYWLFSPNKADEWGFMFKDRRQDTFAKRYPAEWKIMTSEGTGQFQNENGLFTFVTVYPLEEGYRSSSGFGGSAGQSSRGVAAQEYFWILVSKVSPERMESYTLELMGKLFLWGAGLFIFISVGAWYLAMAITKRRIYQAQLVTMALYDALTGLPNRKLFFDQLKAGIEVAERYDRQLGLLYIDLDGFKQVNDTLGHDAGDELLIQVGQRLNEGVRKSDTVARLGGDEFAIALLEVESPEDAKKVGDKIVAALSQPFQLQAGQVQIGASIGAAVYPFHESSLTALIKRADGVMYEAKTQGKNTCILAHD